MPSRSSHFQILFIPETIEKKGLTEIKEILEEVAGGWPVLKGSSWNESNFDWMDTKIKLISKGFYDNTMFSFSVGINLDNSSFKIIQVGEAAFLVSIDILKNKIEDRVLEAYRDSMINIAVHFGAERKYAEKELESSFTFEKKLANLSTSNVIKKLNISFMNNLMTIEELQYKYPYIPWLQYIQKNVDGINITKEEKVLLLSPKYFDHLKELLETTPKRILANYMIWNIIFLAIPFLPKSVQDEEYKFLQKIVGTRGNPNRWRECTQRVVLFMPTLVGSLYIRRHFDEKSKKMATELTNNLREVVVENLKNVDWMDEKTKASALKKSQSFSQFIAYPDELLDDKSIEENYGYLNFSTESYLTAALNLQKSTHSKMYNSLREKMKKDDWRTHGFVTKINAFYKPQENAIVVTAAILQGVFFNKNRPNYMNYGGIGWIIGHEITHAFDTTGSQFDEDGNLKNWWEEKTFKSFARKTDCIIKQYSNYAVPDLNITEDGFLTKDENIADNGGIKLAYLAYEKWVKNNREEPKLPGLNYNPKQMFWIAAAQNFCEKHNKEATKLRIELEAHALGRFRVIGSFSNSKYFSKDFNCPLGSKMNPIQKCTVW